MLAHVDRMLPFIRERNTSSTEFQKLGLQTKALVDGWRQELDLIVADEDRVLKLAIAGSEAAKQRFKGALGLSIILGIAGALLAVRLFTSAITKRLQVLEQNAARLQEGSTLLPLGRGSDEICRLGTAMERASQLLAHRSERLRVALRTAKLAILEMDATGLIRYEGENEFIDSTGYAVDILPRTSKGLFELIDPRDRAEVERSQAKPNFMENIG